MLGGMDVHAWEALARARARTHALAGPEPDPVPDPGPSRAGTGPGPGRSLDAALHDELDHVSAVLWKLTR